MSGPSEDWFASPSGPPREPAPPAGRTARAPQPAGPTPPSPDPAAGRPPGPPGGAGQDGTAGWYPQQAYYAPGWSAPVPPTPPVRRRPGRRFWLPVAGLAAVGLVTVAVFGARFWLDRRPLGTVDAATTVASTRVGLGHCLKGLPADGDVGRATVVPCDEPHVAEVIATLSLPATSWPGQQDVDDSLARWCEMDSAERAAGFHAIVWGPSARGWGQGDRTGLCLAALTSGTATGSFTQGQPVTTS